MNKPTRIVVTAALAVALALPVIAQATRFPDVPTTHLRQADIAAAADQGWFIGKTDGTYDPEGNITPGQMARVIGRMFPNGMTRAEFASLLLVTNQWSQNGKPTFTGTPTTTTRPTPTRPSPTTTESPSTAEREALAALLDSPLWSASPTDVFGWSNEQVKTVGDAALEDVREMIQEAQRIREEWAARDTKDTAWRLWSWWDDVWGDYEDHRSQRPQLEEIIRRFTYAADGLSWTASDYLREICDCA